MSRITTAAERGGHSWARRTQGKGHEIGMYLMCSAASDHLARLGHRAVWKRGVAEVEGEGHFGKLCLLILVWNLNSSSHYLCNSQFIHPINGDNKTFLRRGGLY